MQHFKYADLGVALEHNNKSNVKTRNADDFTGWKQVGNFSSYCIFAKDELRRLVDSTTGKVAIEYSVPGGNSNAEKWV